MIIKGFWRGPPRNGGGTVIDWAGVIKTGVSAAVIVAMVGFVLRSLFGQVLSRDIEKFKAKLSYEHDAQIERLQTDLKIAASEHETRFALLHGTRAETIEQLYARLARTHRVFCSYLHLIQHNGVSGQEAKEKEAERSCRDLHEYFDEKRIYFEASLCEAIDDSYDWCQRALSDMHGYPPGMPGRVEKWEQTYNSLNDHFLPIKARIEQQFRELIGVRTDAGNIG